MSKEEERKKGNGEEEKGAFHFGTYGSESGQARSALWLRVGLVGLFIVLHDEDAPKPEAVPRVLGNYPRSETLAE